MTESSNRTTAAQMKSLIGRRAQIKATCTRFRAYLDDEEAQRASVIELRQRLQRFSETWNNFNEIQMAIEELEADSGEVVIHGEEKSAFENKYFAITAELETLIER